MGRVARSIPMLTDHKSKESRKRGVQVSFLLLYYALHIDPSPVVDTRENKRQEMFVYTEFLVYPRVVVCRIFLYN